MSEALTHARLKELLDYDPETGVFMWRQCPLGKNSKREAGTCNCGYRRIRISRVNYMAHRLAWFYVHGVLPRNDIDHIDGNRGNNRIDNLRDVPVSVNMQNIKKAPKNSRTGLLGAQHCTGQRFSSQITVSGKSKWLGYFDTAEEAHAAYLAAKRAHHEGCTI